MHRPATAAPAVRRGLVPALETSTGVLVLGMHRSGTSVLTRVVNLLGVPLARDASPLHWESGALTNFQEDLLARLGGSWDAPPPLPRGWERHPRLLPSVARARRLFREQYGGRRAWAWKDPRTALTLPLWRRALRDTLLAVVIHRHPLEVWRSLELRDGFSEQKALALWDRYYRSVLDNVSRLSTFAVAYEDLVRDPVAVAGSLRVFLATHDVPAHEPVGDELREFIDPRLRHSAYGDASLSGSQREVLDRLRSLGS